MFATVVCTTLFSFGEFQYNGQVWFFESVKKVTCSAWIPPLGKLLKLASVNRWIFMVFKFTFENFSLSYWHKLYLQLLHEGTLWWIQIQKNSCVVAKFLQPNLVDQVFSYTKFSHLMLNNFPVVHSFFW